MPAKLNYYEAKIIIVGPGGVGKTSLIRMLVDNHFDASLQMTHGIEITEWKVDKEDKSYNLSFWDFGGQEIYHSTHQFFLSKRAIYVFIWNSRSDDDLITFNYWLNLISFFGEGSSILVVQSKADERVKPINERAIKEKFPDVRSFHAVSVKENRGVEELKKAIIQEVEKLEHTEASIPIKWQTIKRKLKSISKNKPFLTLESYLDLCKSEKIEEEHAYLLSNYLNDLGVIIHFQENLILKNIIFTVPNWITDSIYKLIDSKLVFKNQGRFNFKDLEEIWSDYDKSMHIQLVELGKQFEILFQLGEKQDYLIPELLPNSSPEFEWNKEKNLVFKYSYAFMPKGILFRFIVRNNELIYNDIFWRKGVLLKAFDSTALIQEKPYDNIIEIRINGENKSNLLSVIQAEFDSIHNSLNEPRVRKLIPCICKDCVSGANPYYFDFDALLKRKEKGVKSTMCAKSYIQVNVVSLLGKIQEKNLIYSPKEEKVAKVRAEAISYDWNESDNLRLEIHINHSDNYLFQKLKTSIAHIVSFNLNSDELFIVEREESKALIINSIEENKLKISITGYGKEVLLGILRYEIEKNSRNLYTYKEVVRCNCSECKKEQPYYFEYEFILRRLKKRKNHVTCHSSADDLEITSLLNQHYDDNEKEEIRHVEFVYSSKKKENAISNVVVEEINKIKKLIAKNNTSKALDQLTKIFESINNLQGLNACILHSSMLTELQMRKNLSLIDFNQEGMGKSRINNSILELIQMEFDF